MESFLFHQPSWLSLDISSFVVKFKTTQSLFQIPVVNTWSEMGWKAHLIKFTRIVDQTINPDRLHKSFVVGYKLHWTYAFVTECKHMSATHICWFSGEVPFLELNLNVISFLPILSLNSKEKKKSCILKATPFLLKLWFQTQINESFQFVATWGDFERAVEEQFKPSLPQVNQNKENMSQYWPIV